MPKARTPKKLPEHMKPLPDVCKEGDLEMRMKSLFLNHNARLKKKRAVLNSFEDIFNQAGNPLSAWDAFILARKWELPIPEWVYNYLEKSADRLLRTKNTPADVLWALGFEQGDGPSAWRQYHRFQIRETALAHVLQRAIEEPKYSIDDLCFEAVEVVKKKWGQEVEWDSIKKWYYAVIE